MVRAIQAGRRGDFIFIASDAAQGTGGYMGSREVRASLAVLALFAFSPNSASAQSAAPGATVDLPAIVVTTTQKPQAKKKKASKKSSGPSQAQTAPAESDDGSGSDESQRELSAAEQATETLAAIPGGTAVVGRQDMPVGVNTSLAEMLAYVPGVVVQNFFGSNDQPRLQIRGSGLQQNPSERGTLVLQDGLPINRADGSYIVGFADPKSAEFVEIYRGYTANRLGATVLGGAINFVSPTGITAPGAEVSVEGGSFGHFATSVAAGAQQGNVDAHASVSYSERDGYRVYNESERTNVNVNVGARVNENINTRLFFGYTDLGFDVAGPLSRTLLEQDPTQICLGPTTCLGPNVKRDAPRREAEQFRIGSRTSARYGANLFDVALGYTYTDDMFRFPISGGVRDTDGGDFTTVLRYAYAPDASRTLPLFEITGQYAIGSADRRYFINNQGKRGALIGDNNFDSSTLSINAGFNIPLTDRLTLSPSIAYSYATRDNDDVYNDPTRPYVMFSSGGVVSGSRPFVDTSYDRSYSGWSPSVALNYDLARDQSVFVAVSRSFEPPTQDDLIATINGSPNASAGATGVAVFSTPDLDAQTATTLEGGWKGRNGNFAWSAIAYYSWVRDELLNLRDASGVSLGAVNADRTTHFGVEIGGSVDVTRNVNVRLAYTYQDFRFDGDRNHGDNRLAGAPSHIVNAALRYTLMPGFWVESEVNWVPDETPVDNANNLFNDPYVLVNLRSQYALNENLSLYGEVSNVFDETYASATLVVDQVSNLNQAVFIPGDGRAFIGGMKAKF
jgi:iron complex outermembrane receptor protein